MKKLFIVVAMLLLVMGCGAEKDIAEAPKVNTSEPTPAPTEVVESQVASVVEEEEEVPTEIVIPSSEIAMDEVLDEYPWHHWGCLSVSGEIKERLHYSGYVAFRDSKDENLGTLVYLVPREPVAICTLDEIDEAMREARVNITESFVKYNIPFEVVDVQNWNGSALLNVKDFIDYQLAGCWNNLDYEFKTETMKEAISPDGSVRVMERKPDERFGLFPKFICRVTEDWAISGDYVSGIDPTY